jgi:hypothetical protein
MASAVGDCIGGATMDETVKLIPFDSKSMRCALCPGTVDYYLAKGYDGRRRVYLCKGCLQETAQLLFVVKL